MDNIEERIADLKRRLQGLPGYEGAMAGLAGVTLTSCAVALAGSMLLPFGSIPAALVMANAAVTTAAMVRGISEK